MVATGASDNLHTLNLVTQCLCIPITTIFVALRFWTRYSFKQSLGVEDRESTLDRGSRNFCKDHANNLTVACTLAWVR